MKLFPIVLTFDDHYSKYASVVIASLIQNNNKDFLYEINVVCESINSENKNKLEQQIENLHNFKLRFHFLENVNTQNLHLNSYMTASTYYRLYIPEIFKDYEKVLYIDCDVIVDADISELMTMDFEDKLAICCYCPYISKVIRDGGNSVCTLEYFIDTLKLPQPLKYFNAGVMLYNIKKMNELNISTHFFNALKEIKEPILQDQDILNSVLSRNGGVKFISQHYNMINTGLKFTLKSSISYFFKRLFGFSKKEAKSFYIYHYVGKDKPWNKQSPFSFSNIFFHYAKLSPFYQEIINNK